MTDLVASSWGWALVAGAAGAVIAAPLVRRLPSSPRPGGGRLVGILVWEGIVYGFGEAILLATLPVLAGWHAVHDLGWTGGALAQAGSGAMAVVAALLVTLIHHIGYEEFRMRKARPKLAGALVTCDL